jgi:hypothetical protein
LLTGVITSLSAIPVALTCKDRRTRGHQPQISTLIVEDVMLIVRSCIKVIM